MDRVDFLEDGSPSDPEWVDVWIEALDDADAAGCGSVLSVAFRRTLEHLRCINNGPDAP